VLKAVMVRKRDESTLWMVGVRLGLDLMRVEGDVDVLR
jgi:hypothetical protein